MGRPFLLPFCGKKSVQLTRMRHCRFDFGLGGPEARIKYI